MPHSSILFLLVLTLWPNLAHAYLDPSSGSALMTALVAALSGIIYHCRSFYYRFIRKHKSHAEQAHVKNKESQQARSIIIFSEGKNYWGTFAPIVNELIQREIPFRYISFGLHDPGLQIESRFMRSKLLKENSRGYAYFALLEADVMLSTTPNIGAANVALPRPKGVKELVHVFHSVDDIALYPKYSLDCYDTVLMSADFQKKSIREIEAVRKLKKKTLLSTGLPYLDQLAEKNKTLHQSNQEGGKQNLSASDNKKMTVLIGSSWGDKGCLKSYGTGFIRQLCNNGYRVIVRAHPQSYLSEARFIKDCQQDLSDLEYLIWDKTVSPLNSMQQANILISDTSSLRFDFAFIFNKPVITLDIPRDQLEGFEADDLNGIWLDQVNDKIGAVVYQQNIDELSSTVKHVLSNRQSLNIETLKSKTVAHWGESSRHIVNYLHPPKTLRKERTLSEAKSSNG